MAWTVVNAHYPALFIGGFLFFLGFVKATAPYQSRVDLKAPLLVGFFLAGLVIHGGLQGWWIAPVLAEPLGGAAVPRRDAADGVQRQRADHLPGDARAQPDETAEMAVVEGAVTGGGLTVIANAPNPAGQALLARFFGGAVLPLRLLLAALIPTLVATVAFRVL